MKAYLCIQFADGLPWTDRQYCCYYRYVYIHQHKACKCHKNILIDLLLPFGITLDSGGLAQKKDLWASGDFNSWKTNTGVHIFLLLSFIFSEYYVYYMHSALLRTQSITFGTQICDSEIDHTQYFFLMKLNESRILIIRKLHSWFRFLLVARSADQPQ